jgi:azurin
MRTLLIATGIAAATQLGVAAAQETATKEAAPATEEKATTKADVEVVIEGNDTMKFNKEAFTVKEGQTVALTFKNVGNLPKAAMGHNIVILQAGTVVPNFAMACMPNAQTTGLPNEDELKEQVIAASKVLGPGEEDIITFTAPAAGEYPYICTFPGHFGIMKGVMTVEAK